jgi:two-component system chemotaxis response regulator CheB
LKNILENIDAIVIGGSAGSFPVMRSILESLPSDFNIPIFLSLHRLKNVRHGFKEALSIKSKVKIIEPTDKYKIVNNEILLAPSNYHMYIELNKTISLSTEETINNSRPSIDLTFDSASYVYKSKLLAILLSGANKDGARGMYYAEKRGSYTVVQDPNECVIDTMTKSALSLTKVNEVLTANKIKQLILSLHKRK